MSVHEPFYNFFSLALSLSFDFISIGDFHIFFFENIHSIWLSSGHKMSFVVDKMSERVWRRFKKDKFVDKKWHNDLCAADDT